jgi:hypothetical protein
VLLQDILTYVNGNPGATNFRVAEAFGLTRGMADRYLEMLEDAGHFYLDRPAEVCTGCTVKGPAATLNALAAAARAKSGSNGTI